MTIDVFKRKKVAYHCASKLTLPPPPGGSETPNESGLPRRIVVTAIIPAEAPPLLGANDGNCYQVVMVFGASAAALNAWRAGGSAAYKLFARFFESAPEGVLPSAGDLELKERLKLLPRLDNMASVGIPGWIQGYNGKPALLTKSGAIFRGDDYLELDMNTFRFGFVTKKGVNHLLPGFEKYDFHAAMTIEGRDDAELPEQVLLATRIRGLDMVNLAQDSDFLD